jgi:hypothetical protein
MNVSLFFDPKVDLENLRRVLDTSGHTARVLAIRGMNAKQLATLFEACADSDPLTLDDFVPPGEAMTEVIHDGKNSLPAFTSFQKRFCRPDGDAGDVLWGYNHNPKFEEAAIGPGYFVASVHEKGEVKIDYTQLPPRRPEGWPAIIPNSSRLGFLVWSGMQDFCRRVSTHVTIGRAYKGGKPFDAWFALCRKDPAPAA